MALLPKGKEKKSARKMGFVLDPSDNPAKQSALLTSDSWSDVMPRVAASIESGKENLEQSKERYANLPTLREHALAAKQAKANFFTMPDKARVTTVGDFYEVAKHYASQVPNDRAAQLVRKTAENRFKRASLAVLTIGEIKNWVKSARLLGNSPAVDLMVTDGLAQIAAFPDQYNVFQRQAHLIKSQNDFDRVTAEHGLTSNSFEHRFARAYLAKLIEDAQNEDPAKTAARLKLRKRRARKKALDNATNNPDDNPHEIANIMRDNGVIQPRAEEDGESKEAQGSGPRQGWYEEEGAWVRVFGDKDEAVIVEEEPGMWRCYWGPDGHLNETPFTQESSLQDAKIACEQHAYEVVGHDKFAQHEILHGWEKEPDLGSMQCWAIDIAHNDQNYKARVCESQFETFLGDLHDETGETIFFVTGKSSFDEVEEAMMLKLDQMPRMASAPENVDPVKQAHLDLYRTCEGIEGKEFAMRISKAGKLLFTVEGPDETFVRQACMKRVDELANCSVSKCARFEQVPGGRFVAETKKGRIVIESCRTNVQPSAKYAAFIYDADAGIDSSPKNTALYASLGEAMRKSSRKIADETTREEVADVATTQEGVFHPMTKLSQEDDDDDYVDEDEDDYDYETEFYGELKEDVIDLLDDYEVLRDKGSLQKAGDIVSLNSWESDITADSIQDPGNLYARGESSNEGISGSDIWSLSWICEGILDGEIKRVEGRDIKSLCEKIMYGPDED